MLKLVTLATTLSVSLAIPQPPAEDQCQDINATEPSECPQTIGPPCPPCISNTMPDYTSGSNATIPNSLKSIMSMLIDSYSSFWLDNYGPNVTYPNNSDAAATSWVEGSAGRSQLFLRLYSYTSNITYFKIAKAYFEHGLSILPSTQTSADFFTSQVGLWTVGAVINDTESKMTGHQSKQTKKDSVKNEYVPDFVRLENNNDKNNGVKATNEYVAKIQDTLEDVRNGIVSGSSTSPKYGINLDSATIFGGVSGALYAGLLVNEYFDDNELIPQSVISNMTYYLLDMGIDTAQNSGRNYLVYETGFTPNCYMPGAAHGSSGVLNQILNAYVKGYVPDLFTVADRKYFNVIKNTLDYYTEIQLEDGNIPPYLTNDTICVAEADALGMGNDTDSRVQWCHGAPGFLDTIPKGVLIWSTLLDGVTSNDTLLNDAQRWLTSSLKALNATWERGILIKGLMMCHGVGGNAYTMLHFYDNLNNLINNVINSGDSKTWKGIGKYDLNSLSYYKQQSAFRASQFIQWTLNEYHDSKLRTQYSDENYSPWLGSYSIPFIWIQAMQNDWPYSQPVCMPAWNLCIP